LAVYFHKLKPVENTVEDTVKEKVPKKYFRAPEDLPLKPAPLRFLVGDITFLISFSQSKTFPGSPNNGVPTLLNLFCRATGINRCSNPLSASLAGSRS
jgi:hypothetical protein